MTVPWMQSAWRELGVAEVPGPKTQKRIAEYLKSVGQPGNDEISWCSAFANWCVERSGEHGTGKANARSWLEWGVKSEPRYGAITVFWRDSPESWKGHVAFYLDELPDSIIVLGGNQANRVCVSAYPRARLLGYRWPVKW